MFGIPREFTGDVKIYDSPTNDVNVPQLTWFKPKRCTWGFMFSLGPGGGGGGGFSGIAGSARGGGGAGAGGTIATWGGPLFLLPESLKICVGLGGLPGGPGADGGIGWFNKIMVGTTETATGNMLLFNSFANGGIKGTAAGGGAGGTSGGVSALANNPIASIGLFQSVVGQTGAAGGAHTGAVGGSITVPATGALSTGGCGGAGVTAADFAGGGFNSTAGLWSDDLRPLAPAAGSNPGGHGFNLWEPFFSYGGCGGSSSNAGNGGNGGNGGPGGGGGGGGGGVTAGSGGYGGNGLIIIMCW